MKSIYTDGLGTKVSAVGEPEFERGLYCCKKTGDILVFSEEFDGTVLFVGQAEKQSLDDEVTYIGMRVTASQSCMNKDFWERVKDGELVTLCNG